jgi:hypothetical protein
MKSLCSRVGSFWLPVFAGFLPITLGCGDSAGTLVLVKGYIKVDDRPLRQGIVTFYPDVEKGNTSKFAPKGIIQEDGSYVLKTMGKEGAPVGWYRVTITTGVPPSGAAPSGPSAVPVRINSRYNDPTKTPLVVEVSNTAQPDTYNFKVTPQ